LAGKRHGALDGPELTPALLAHLAQRAESFDPYSRGIEGWSRYVLVMPRSASSRHLVFLLIGDNGLPEIVVKLPRIPDDDSGIRQEARNLRLLAARLSSGDARVPRVLLFDRWGSRRLLVEEALNGETLQPARQIHRAVDDVLAWLRVATAPSGTRRMVGTRYASLVARPLSMATRVLAAAGADAARLRSLAERTLSPLRGSQLPLVFEHGHLGCRSILRLRQGGIGVIDWEYGRPDGVPLADLSFFLSSLTEGARRDLSPQGVVEELMAPGSWRRDTLEAFARGLYVPPRLVTPLIVLAWTRQLAALSLRLHPGLADPSADVPYQVAASVATHRHRWVWEAALRVAASER
jgi:hypothetical protein